MKILLISPTWKKDVGKKRLIRDKIFKFPPHSLIIVAALTPRDIKIELIDENVEDIDFNKKADLVGITTMTASAPRAYEIADIFSSHDGGEFNPKERYKTNLPRPSTWVGGPGGINPDERPSLDEISNSIMTKEY